MAASSLSSSTPSGTRARPQPNLRYPYPNLFNVANCMNVTLTSKNYLVWESQMVNLIESQDMMGLDGSTPAPSKEIVSIHLENGPILVPNPDFLLWKKSDQLLKRWMWYKFRSRKHDSNKLVTRVICQICRKQGHIAFRCWSRFDQSLQPPNLPTALAAMTVTDTNLNEWLSNSGASAHMTGDAGIFSSLNSL